MRNRYETIKALAITVLILVLVATLTGCSSVGSINFDANWDNQCGTKAVQAVYLSDSQRLELAKRGALSIVSSE